MQSDRRAAANDFGKRVAGARKEASSHSRIEAGAARTSASGRARQHQRRDEQTSNCEEREHRSSLAGRRRNTAHAFLIARASDAPRLVLFFIAIRLSTGQARFLAMLRRAVLLVEERPQQTDFFAAQK